MPGRPTDLAGLLTAGDLNAAFDGASAIAAELRGIAACVSWWRQMTTEEDFWASTPWYELAGHFGALSVSINRDFGDHVEAIFRASWALAAAGAYRERPGLPAAPSASEALALFLLDFAQPDPPLDGLGEMTRVLEEAVPYGTDVTHSELALALELALAQDYLSREDAEDLILDPEPEAEANGPAPRDATWRDKVSALAERLTAIPAVYQAESHLSEEAVGNWVDKRLGAWNYQAVEAEVKSEFARAAFFRSNLAEPGPAAPSSAPSLPAQDGAAAGFPSATVARVRQAIDSLGPTSPPNAILKAARVNRQRGWAILSMLADRGLYHGYKGPRRRQ